jgi:hypothetical protein
MQKDLHDRMKPGHLIQKAVWFGLALSFMLLPACKKRKEFREETGLIAEDIRMFQAQAEEVLRMVNIAVMEQAPLRGRSSGGEETAGRTELCGVEVDTLGVYSGITRLNYNGAACDGIRRSGSLEVKIENYPLKKWKHKDCRIKIVFEAYKATYPNQKSIQIDGEAYLTNESGQTWYDLRYLNASALVQSFQAANLKIRYDGTHTAIFHSSRRLRFSQSAEVTTCQVEGTGEAAGISGLDNWGQDRHGMHFSTELIAPLQWNTTCGGTAPLAGEALIRQEGKSLQIHCYFPVDKDGTQINYAGSCPYGWKLSWSHRRNTHSRVVAYP